MMSDEPEEDFIVYCPQIETTYSASPGSPIRRKRKRRFRLIAGTISLCSVLSPPNVDADEDNPIRVRDYSSYRSLIVNCRM